MRWKWKQKLAGFMAFCMLLSGAMPVGSQTVYASSAEDAETVEEGEPAETDEAMAVSETEVEDATVATESEAIVDETTAAETATETEAETVTDDADVETVTEDPSQDEEVAADENTSQETADEVAAETAEEPSVETESKEIFAVDELNETVESDKEETVSLTSAEATISDDGESAEVSLESVEVISSPITTFYYGLDDGYIYMRNGEFQFTFSDGSTVECTPWDETWDEIWYAYGLYYTLSADGSGIEYDAAGYQPVGEYAFVIFAADGTEYLTIPYSVLSPEDISLEMNSDDTLSGLSGDSYDYSSYGTKGNYIKLQVEEGVSYELASTSYVMFRLWDKTYDNVTNEWSYSFRFTAEYTGIYYLKVSSFNDFELSMESLLGVTSIELVTSPRTTFYYALDERIVYYPSNVKILLTFEDESSVECTLWDSNWYEYGMSFSNQAADGGSIAYDGAGYQPVGEYQYVFYVNGKEVLTIPYEVISLDNIDLELGADETISDLSGDGSYYGSSSERYYLKLQVEEGVTYNLTSTSDGYFKLWSEEDGYVVDTWGTSCGFTATFTGEYYLKVSCYSDFSLSMTSIPAITSLEVTENPRTTYYYRLDEVCYVPYHAEFLVTFEDGSSMECMYQDDVWYQYNMSYDSLTSDGNSVTYDAEGCQPVGDYQYVIYVNGTEYAMIPYTVLSLEEITLEMEAGETLSGLSGDGDNYGWYSDGNYLKIRVEEGKVYSLTSTEYCSFRIWDESDDYADSNDSISFNLTADYTGIYYVRVSCADDFDLTLTEYSSVIGIEVVTSPVPVLYYGLDYFYYAVGNTELKLYLEDGSSVNCTAYDDTWNRYGLSYTMLTVDGNDWSYDSSGCLPIGEYMHVYSVGDYTATSAFSVVSAEEAPELENGAVTVWDNTMSTAYKLTVEEDGTYSVSITADNYMYLRIYTTELALIASVNSITSEWTVELGAGTYYIHLFSYSFPNSATFSLTRMGELVDMTYDGDPITFTYGSWGYSVGTTVSGNNCDFESGEQIVGTQTTGNGGITYEGFYFDGLTLNLKLTDGSILEAIYDSTVWWLYDIIQEFFTADGEAVYADENGYVPVGDYLVKFSSGDVSVSIPFSVVEDVSEVSQPEIVSVYSTVQTSAKITWTEVDGADGYQIYRSTAEDGIYTCVKTITDGSTASYTNSGLTVGKTYYYKVRAYALDSSNSRVYSDFSEVRYMPAAVVFDNVYSNSTSRIRILWNEVSGAEGYQIWRADSEDGTYTIVKTITDGSTTSYSNTGLEAGHTYYYKMRAYTTVDGSKVFGTFSDVKAVPVIPETVVLENVYSNSTSRVRILWNEVDGAAGYQIWRADSENGTYSIIKTITSGSTTSYSNTDVSSGQTYYYKIRAYSEADGSKVFGAYSKVTAVSVMPDTPTLTISSYTSGIAKLSWDSVDGAAGYQIWRADSANGTYTLVKSITDGSTTSYSNSGLTSKTTYYYKVRAYSEVNGEKTFGAYSEIKSITVK